MQDELDEITQAKKKMQKKMQEEYDIMQKKMLDENHMIQKKM